MPKIGEIRKGREIGFDSGGLYIWHACLSCGKQRWVHAKRGQPRHKYCRPCGLIARKLPKGELSPTWKGGRNQGGGGYIRIKVPETDFFYQMAGKQGYVAEHRLIMAKHLNRCLLPWEVVHHKNSIRDDNRIENLELLPTSTPHIVDSIAKIQLRRLQKKVEKQIEEIKTLKTEVRLLRLSVINLREEQYAYNK